MNAGSSFVARRAHRILPVMSILPDALTGLQQWPLYYFLIPALATLLGVFLSDSGWSWKLRPFRGISKPLPSPIEEKLGHDFQKSPYSSMGEIQALSNLDLDKVEPRQIYKFNSKYFLTMGLQNTNINFITQMDKQYLERMQERQKILDTHPNALRCLPNAIPMVNELYDYFVTEYLPKRYPTIFKLTPSTKPSYLLNTLTQDQLPTTTPSNPIEALRLLAINIDEDFLMLLPAADGDGYSLQSFVWCYPVGFDAGDKLGMKLREAHRPVPHYKDRLQQSMDRYFGRLEVGRVVYRVNWAIATNASLCEDGEYHLYEGQEISETATDIDISNCYIRCELQTLFALPKSGGRILSVHLYLYPLQKIKDEGLAAELLVAIDGLKEGNAPGFWRYKRAPVWEDKVKAFLRS